MSTYTPDYPDRSDERLCHARYFLSANHEHQNNVLPEPEFCLSDEYRPQLVLFCHTNFSKGFIKDACPALRAGQAFSLNFHGAE